MEVARAFVAADRSTSLSGHFEHPVAAFGSTVVVTGQPFNGNGWGYGYYWAMATETRLRAQGMLAAGRDAIFTWTDRCGVVVASFEAPTAAELEAAHRWGVATFGGLMGARDCMRLSAGPTAAGTCSGEPPSCKAEGRTLSDQKQAYPE